MMEIYGFGVILDQLVESETLACLFGLIGRSPMPFVLFADVFWPF